MDACQLNSGSQMPLLGLGTWQGQGDQVKQAVLESLKVGYRLIDGAFAYQNEISVGEALKEAFDTGIVTRKDLFYTSKLPHHGHRRENVKFFLEKTLKSLGLDYLDLYLIHFPVATQFLGEKERWPVDQDGRLLVDNDVDMLDTWKGMEDCVDAGLVKSIGLSNYNIKQIQHIYDNARIKPANLQVECHIYLQQNELIEFCRGLGISVTAYSPLGSPGSAAVLQKTGQEEAMPNILEEPLLLAYAKKHKKTPAQVALRFLVQRGISVIPKSVTPKRIQENLQIFDFELEEEEMTGLQALNKDARIFDLKFIKGITDGKNYPWK